jgi:hypothetical protein
MRNLARIGGFAGVGPCVWVLVAPIKCLSVNARQTHRVQRQEKVSPSAKKACVYGTSVNISQQRSGTHGMLTV